MQPRHKWIIGGLALILLLICGLAGGAWYFVETPLRATDNAVVVFTVEQGESLLSVAGRLEKENLVRCGQGFRTYGRLRKAPLQAGEFELSASMSPRRILDTLAFGRPMLHRLHFAEGLTMREVALAVNATGLTTAKRFLEACRDKEFLRKNGIPAENAEGYLFPETYFFPRIPDQSPYPILQTLLNHFKAVVKELPQAENPKELHDLVILASLVEKETAVPAERALVAGVYTKRLELGMLLQCDPTIIYGLGEAFTGNLRRSHLQDATNPYNTYVHPGHPPGPICSPGKAALMAAAYPAEHEFLYFVARPDGSHHFSRSLSEHNNAVIKYQRGGRPFPKSRGTN